jgi:hypothetical protein
MRIQFQPAATVVALTLLLILAVSAGSQQTKSGAISGHVLACNDGAIAGAEVMLAGQALDQPIKAVTDATGRYRIAGLPPGVYALEISRPLFQIQQRSGIEITSGSELTLDITLQVVWIGGGGRIIEDLAATWRSVDAVVYLRIQKSSGVRPLRMEGQCVSVATEWRAAVLEVFRRYRGEPREFTMTFLQLAAGTWRSDTGTITGPGMPLKPGDEIIAFLRWNGSLGSFQDRILVPVREGQARSPYIEELQKGLKLEALLEKLRAMME